MGLRDFWRGSKPVNLGGDDHHIPINAGNAPPLQLGALFRPGGQRTEPEPQLRPGGESEGSGYPVLPPTAQVAFAPPMARLRDKLQAQGFLGLGWSYPVLTGLQGLLRGR